MADISQDASLMMGVIEQARRNFEVMARAWTTLGDVNELELASHMEKMLKIMDSVEDL
jgi:hypothetical protein